MTTPATRQEQHLSRRPETGKMRYAIFGSGPDHEIWLISSPDYRHWIFINRFPSRTDARDAIGRYLDARASARAIAARL